MPATISPISDMLVTVKSREVQRALFAESAGDREPHGGIFWRPRIWNSC